MNKNEKKRKRATLLTYHILFCISVLINVKYKTIRIHTHNQNNNNSNNNNDEKNIRSVPMYMGRI